MNKKVRKIGAATGGKLLPHVVGGHRTSPHQPSQSLPPVKPARNKGPDHIFELEPDPYEGKRLTPEEGQRLKEELLKKFRMTG